MTERLLDVLSRIGNVETQSVIVGLGDYKSFPAPLWAKWTAPWESEYIARQKVRAMNVKQFDVLIVNCWEYTVAFRRLASSIPTAVMLDAVPTTVDAQLSLRGRTGWRRWPTRYVHHPAFMRAARNVKVFLPLASECAEALQKEYGITKEQCVITLVPQDIDIWKPFQKDFHRPLRLLFVGNDFQRKGGEFLLRLYSDHLSTGCTLQIVSNDPCLSGRVLPNGVEHTSGKHRAELLEIYRKSDVLVLPTRQDYLPQVLGEALATGLPCIATDVGGIRDLVIDDKTGYLMTRDAPIDAWVARIHRLIDSPDVLQRLSRGARDFAEEMLDSRKFERMLAARIEELTS